ncbi:hypothetical protein JKF63_01749 [Porcisia hertigi]|uniref:Uncharacterized protein n=1 Tax=Porcisia hertigi TaxID=2761500 RepID=A0A836H5A9_9TRYP|nr:hypothetical protein JKF63_01749 [Porcisia hertigi]
MLSSDSKDCEALEAAGTDAANQSSELDLRHPSLRTGELNRGAPNAWLQAANASATQSVSGVYNLGLSKRQVDPHLQRHGRAEHTLHGSRNHAHPKALQQRPQSATPLTPALSTSTVKTVKCICTPLRLDSQVLASPWPGHGWPPGQTPTAHNSGCRIISPSLPSSRPSLPFQQYGNDGNSPAQLSFSNLGHENSFLTASSSFVSPSNNGVMHSAILDAPLQVSLAPPPHRDDRPLFSFGNSIMQSFPFTPTLPSSASRGHSIYRDAMMELARKNEVETPLATALFDGARVAASAAIAGSAAYNYKAKPVRGSGTPSSFGNAVASGASPNAHLYNGAVSASSENASVGNREMLADVWAVDWRRFERPSPASSSLMGHLTERFHHRAAVSPGADASIFGSERVAFNLSEDEYEKTPQCCDRTPEVLSSTGRDTQNEVVKVIAAETEGPPSPSFAEQTMPALLDQTVRPREANVKPVTFVEPEFSPAHSDSSSTIAATTSVTAPSLGKSSEITASLVNLSQLSKNRPSTPASASAVATAGRGTNDLHLFMPSPTDQYPHVFGTLRDSAARKSPSEQSTSILSLVPAPGVWQAAPTMMSAWHSLNPTPPAALGTAHSLRDLLEVLRLLQSDMENVCHEVPVSEHVVRRWVRSTLGLLLQLTAELLHSVDLAGEEALEGTGEPTITYTELKAEMTAAAASNGASLHATIEAVEREQENMEPLLLTTMLARGAIASLLQLLSKNCVTARQQSATGTATRASIVSYTPPKQCSTSCSGGGGGYNAPPQNVALLTPEKIEELMDKKTLHEELNSNWPKFTSAYNRHVLRYFCLRALYASCIGKDGGAVVAATEKKRCRTTTHADAAAFSPTPLNTLVSGWVEEQVLHWTAQHTLITPQQRHATTTTTCTHHDLDEPALRESLCWELPSFERVAEVFSSFRDGEGWRWWYSVLDHAMSCNFHVRENKRFFDYAERKLMSSSSAPTRAVQSALAHHEVTLGEIQEALEEAEVKLSAMEESGKAQRVNILQRILRRIFVLSLVASVQRTHDKDMPVTGAQLASYVHLQRKSLAEVEAQLSAHHAECSAHIKHIRTFLSLFPGEASAVRPLSESPQWTPGRSSAASGKRAHRSQPHLSVLSNSTPDMRSDHPCLQWYSPTIVSLAVLLARPRTENDAIDCSDGDPLTATATDMCMDSSAEDRTRTVVSLARDLTARSATTVQGLCTLLQSDTNGAGAHKMYQNPPARMSAPSTRALRRLQASLSEANQCIRLCMTSLRSLD